MTTPPLLGRSSLGVGTREGQAALVGQALPEAHPKGAAVLRALRRPSSAHEGHVGHEGHDGHEGHEDHEGPPPDNSCRPAPAG